jgi:hypothetical protein
MFKIADAKKCLLKLKVNPEEHGFTVKDVKIGMNVELEHGKVHNKTNVTNDGAIKTCKIALAHLFENSRYYAILKKMKL